MNAGKSALPSADRDDASIQGHWLLVRLGKLFGNGR